MNEIFEITVKSNYLFRFLIIVTVLFLFFRLLALVMPIIFRKKQICRLIKKYIPSIELVVWILVLSKTYNKLFLSNKIFAILSLTIVVSIVLYFIWFALKDLVAGIVFKSTSKIELGENVRIDSYTGEIVKFAYRTLNIETIKGEVIYIPYYKIITSSVIKVNLAEAIKTYSFKLEIAKTENIINLIAEIRDAIINLPWSSVKKSPGVYIIEEKSDSVLFDITIYAIEEVYFYNIENYIKEKFAI
ncbi:MAG: mechanosensitive ion channel [Bacteroidota bacterium]|nr:mechanosensitive ion channel [Bacteroidota bacterium]